MEVDFNFYPHWGISDRRLHEYFNNIEIYKRWKHWSLTTCNIFVGFCFMIIDLTMEEWAETQDVVNYKTLRKDWIYFRAEPQRSSYFSLISSFGALGKFLQIVIKKSLKGPIKPTPLCTCTCRSHKVFLLFPHYQNIMHWTLLIITPNNCTSIRTYLPTSNEELLIVWKIVRNGSLWSISLWER